MFYPQAAVQPSAELLESNALLAFADCPFAPRDWLAALLTKDAIELCRHDIVFDVGSARLSGWRAQSTASTIAAALGQFATTTAQWLADAVPGYRSARLDRVVLHTQEEATRPLRLSARNDLLHIDGGTNRPTRGRRLLRVFVNVNANEPQVWAVSERFPELLARYRRKRRLPQRSTTAWTRTLPALATFFSSRRHQPSPYDRLMGRLRRFLQENQRFQARAARRVLTFAPGSMWMLMGDGLAHAQLRGRLALECSFFVPEECWARPENAPLALLAAGSRQRLQRAA